ENIGFHPVSEPHVDRVPLAEQGWQVSPRAACSSDPQHRLHKQPVIRAAAAPIARFAEAMRLHLRPLGVGQDKSFHPKLESRYALDVNRNSQQTLERATSPPLHGPVLRSCSIA